MKGNAMKKIIIKNSLIYLSVIMIFAFSKIADMEIIMSWEAFFTLGFFIFLFFLSLTVIEIQAIRRNMRKELVVIEQIKKDYFVRFDGKEHPYLKILVERNQLLKSDLAKQNQEQIKWIHDIKIPLATLQLFIKNQEEILTSEHKKTLDLIALDFDQLIERKLMADKVLLHVDDMVIEKVALYPILANVIKKLSPIFKLKKIRLSLEVDQSIQVTSDAKILRYCFEQIISNALKYTDDGKEITIAATSGTRTVLEIIDTGCGIDSQDIKHIFDYGYTGKNGKNIIKNASSGIGLYMVKQNIEKLQHQIEITSSRDGTNVKIEF